jgi:hypothetical protein
MSTRVPFTQHQCQLSTRNCTMRRFGQSAHTHTHTHTHKHTHTHTHTHTHGAGDNSFPATEQEPAQHNTLQRDERCVCVCVVVVEQGRSKDVCVCLSCWLSKELAKKQKCKFGLYISRREDDEEKRKKGGSATDHG